MGSQCRRVTSPAAEVVGVFPHNHVFLNKLMRKKKEQFALQLRSTNVTTVDMIQTHTAYLTSYFRSQTKCNSRAFFLGHLLGHIFVVAVVGYGNSLEHQTLDRSQTQEA